MATPAAKKKVRGLRLCFQHSAGGEERHLWQRCGGGRGGKEGNTFLLLVRKRAVVVASLRIFPDGGSTEKARQVDTNKSSKHNEIKIMMMHRFGETRCDGEEITTRNQQQQPTLQQALEEVLNTKYILHYFIYWIIPGLACVSFPGYVLEK